MKYINSFNATQIGLYLVIFSASIFMFLGFYLSIYCIKEYDFHPLFSILVFISFSLLIYTPFWSFMLVKWKIWSFRRVDDIEILLILAERKNLVYPKNHFYSKYEICTRKDKELIKKLKRERLRENNINILRKLYLDKEFKIKTYFDILLNKKEFVKINSTGIWLKDVGCIKWNEFSYLKIDFDKSISKQGLRKAWLEYKIRGKKNIINYELGSIGFININYFKLEYLIEVFKKIAKPT